MWTIFRIFVPQILKKNRLLLHPLPIRLFWKNLHFLNHPLLRFNKKISEKIWWHFFALTAYGQKLQIFRKKYIFFKFKFYHYHCGFLEHWNRQKSLTSIQQRFSCLQKYKKRKKNSEFGGHFLTTLQYYYSLISHLISFFSFCIKCLQQ